LAGRTPSRNEVAGITAGYADTASSRAARAATVKQNQETVDQNQAKIDAQAKQFEETLAQQRAEMEQQQRQFDATQEFEDEQAEKARDFQEKQAEKTRKQQTMATWQTTGASIGAYVYGAPGAIIGLVVGTFIGSAADDGSLSYLCNESNRILKNWDEHRDRVYADCREYFRTHNRNGYEFYLKRGPEIVEGIRNAHPSDEEYRAWWECIDRNFLIPMVAVEDRGPYYQAYKDHICCIIIPTYAPHLVEELQVALRADRELAEREEE
jgi:hypothetical protein